MSDYNGTNYPGYHSRNNSDGRKSGRGWMVATMLLVAFVAGAFAMRFLPEGRGLTAQTSPPATVAPTSGPGETQALSTLLPVAAGTAYTTGQAMDIPSIARAIGPAVVGVINKATSFSFYDLDEEVTQGTGSGVIVDLGGTYVVTNYHVIAGAESVSVLLPGGEEVEAEVVGADEQTDLAVLKIDHEGLTAAPIGDSDAMQVGETVIAIGNPLGTELAGTVTAGILSARDRELIVDGYRHRLFQTDAAINPGNSGGALVNTRGELIGINNLKSVSAGTDAYGQTISAEGIGFAIPINDALPILQELIQNGYIPRPILGIESAQEVTKNMASRYRVPQGIFLRSLTPGGAADQAGIRPGDILTAIDDAAILTLADMNTALSSHAVGDTVKAKVWRDGAEKTYDVKLQGNSGLQ